MRVFFYTIFLFTIGVHSQCTFTSYKVLPEGCEVGNLSITEGEQYIDQGRICNFTIDSFPYDYVPQMKFSLLNVHQSLAPSYLLSMVDRTSETLLWMISNLTIQPSEDPFTVLRTDHSVEIKSDSEPISSSYHDVEFHVFEEYRNHSSSNYIYNHLLKASPFNLSTWINSQQYGSIMICGPVAGGNILAYKSAKFSERVLLLKHNDNHNVSIDKNASNADPTPTQKGGLKEAHPRVFGVLRILGIICLFIILLTTTIKYIIACCKKIINRD